MVLILSYAPLASAALLVPVLATPTRRAMTVHEDRSTPSSYASSGKPTDDTVLNLRLALTPVNMPGLETTLYDVSTPGSAKYGQHLSLDEVKAFAAPSDDAVSAVTSWLQESGVSDAAASGPFGDWINFSANVSTANNLLNADFEIFTHYETGSEIIRTLSYSLPQDLLQHIDLVHPTTSFAQPIPKKRLASVVSRRVHNVTVNERANTAPASCDSTVTPACLQALYDIPTSAATQSSNKLAVSGFIEQFPQQADLTQFLTASRPDMDPSTSFTLQTIDGGSDPQGAADAGIEANLDIQYTVGVATGVPVTFISVGENNTDGVSGFIDIIDALNAESAPPQVLTTSYGFNEADLGSTLANRVCNSYMTLGARGTSILFSSGDGGVSGSQSQSCTNFVPTFPSTCQYVTSVGATQGVTETAATFSSGGFSNFFNIPDYQASVVAQYLSVLGSTNSGKFHASGRAFPDVAAQGVDVEIANAGKLGLVDGTSCSSPIFASIIALINDKLIAAGKSPLGFLNPFLYANPSAFFDITTGDNPGCNTNGFPASSGWDPVTGLGTPNFDALLAAAGL
ncbi:hypothetical protein GYMLUDRAFT_34144 [Collybiopsis luxurians FD-317 M1]|nr:hypothetical protein GYMLUDRAFT_34144 [Collybiopsis luxurians FD-317 M1]